MTKLADKVDNALNETRMLVLGAQVLLGFAFESVFQPGFERLPAEMHGSKLLSHVLMLVALALLLAPTAFHQIVEGGNDSERVTQFTGWVASMALLPFALGIGLDIFLATSTVIGENIALPVGVAAAAVALLLWYAVEWFWRMRDRRSGRLTQERHMSEATDLANKIKQVLTEARVVLPGAQALLGFQLAAILTDAFEKLPKVLHYVHLASLGLIALSIVLLMTPAAFHRIVERGEDTDRLHRVSSALVLAALVPLAFGVAGDFFVVAAKILESDAQALTLAALSLLVFFGLWFGFTLTVRWRDNAERSRVELRRQRVA